MSEYNYITYEVIKKITNKRIKQVLYNLYNRDRLTIVKYRDCFYYERTENISDTCHNYLCKFLQKHYNLTYIDTLIMSRAVS